jgi:hypothetical protein
MRLSYRYSRPIALIAFAVVFFGELAEVLQAGMLSVLTQLCLKPSPVDSIHVRLAGC